MKTTVEIADSLFEEARACAAFRNMTLRQIIEEGLRAVIQETGKPGRFRLRDGSFGEPGARHDQTWSGMREKIYQGRGE